MVVVFRKRSKLKAILARNKIALNMKNHTCPACSTPLQLADKGKDRDMYLCNKCNSTITFTKSPAEVGPVKEGKIKQLNSFALRDRSKEVRKSEKSVDNDVGDDAKSVGLVAQVREGMSGRKMLSFVYIDSEGRKSARTVEPYKLTTKDGQIVMYGYDVEAQGIRVFRLGRISALEKQEYEFKPRWDIEDKLAKRTSDKS